jgi:hypothetical protein
MSLVALGGTTAGYFKFFYLDAAGNPGYYAESPGGASLASSNAVSVGQWHSFALTVAPDNVNIYIDGRLDAGPFDSTGNNGEDLSLVSRITVGGLYYPGNAPAFLEPFDGKIADVRLYRGALPPQLVAHIHHNRWDLYDTLFTRKKLAPVIGLTPDAPAPIRFRRTFSALGARAGTRQAFA